jgi:hypothetical protein
MMIDAGVLEVILVSAMADSTRRTGTERMGFGIKCVLGISFQCLFRLAGFHILRHDFNELSDQQFLEMNFLTFNRRCLDGRSLDLDEH